MCGHSSFGTPTKGKTARVTGVLTSLSSAQRKKFAEQANKAVIARKKRKAERANNHSVIATLNERMRNESKIFTKKIARKKAHKMTFIEQCSRFLHHTADSFFHLFGIPPHKPSK